MGKLIANLPVETEITTNGRFESNKKIVEISPDAYSRYHIDVSNIQHPIDIDYQIGNKTVAHLTYKDGSMTVCSLLKEPLYLIGNKKINNLFCHAAADVYIEGKLHVNHDVEIQANNIFLDGLVDAGKINSIKAKTLNLEGTLQAHDIGLMDVKGWTCYKNSDVDILSQQNKQQKNNLKVTTMKVQKGAITKFDNLMATFKKVYSFGDFTAHRSEIVCDAFHHADGIVSFSESSMNAENEIIIVDPKDLIAQEARFTAADIKLELLPIDTGHFVLDAGQIELNSHSDKPTQLNHVDIMSPTVNIHGNLCLSDSCVENIGSYGLASGEKDEQLEISGQVTLDNTPVFIEGEISFDSESQVTIKNCDIEAKKISNEGHLYFKNVDCVNDIFVQDRSRFMADDSKLQSKNIFFSKKAEILLNDSLMKTEALNVHQGKLDMKKGRLKADHLSSSAMVHIDDSQANIKNMEISNQFITDRSILLAKHAEITGDFHAKQSWVDFAALNVDPKGVFDITESNADLRNFNIYGGVRGCGSFFDSYDTTTGAGSHFHLKNSSLLADNINHDGRIVVKHKNNLVIRNAFTTSETSKIMGDKLLVHANGWRNSGDVWLNSLQLKGKTLNNVLGKIRADETLNLGLDYWLLNCLGYLKGNNITISSNFFNVLGAVRADNSLITYGLVDLNLLGFMTAVNYQSIALLSLNAGIYLPNLYGMWKNGLTIYNTLAMTKTALCVCFPQYAALINLAWIGGIFAKQFAPAVYNNLTLDNLSNAYKNLTWNNVSNGFDDFIQTGKNMSLHEFYPAIGMLTSMGVSLANMGSVFQSGVHSLGNLSSSGIDVSSIHASDVLLQAPGIFGGYSSNYNLVDFNYGVHAAVNSMRFHLYGDNSALLYDVQNSITGSVWEKNHGIIAGNNTVINAAHIQNSGDITGWRSVALIGNELEHTGSISGRNVNMHLNELVQGREDGSVNAEQGVFDIRHLDRAEDLIYERGHYNHYHTGNAFTLNTDASLVLDQNFNRCGNMFITSNDVAVTDALEEKGYAIGLTATQGDVEITNNIEAAVVDIHAAHNINVHAADKPKADQAPLLFNDKGFISSLFEVVSHQHVHDSAQQNLPSAPVIKGDAYVQLNAGHDVNVVCQETTYQDKYDTRINDTPSSVIGGENGVVIQADNKVNIDASTVAASGDVIIDGKNGVIFGERHYEYISSHKTDSTWYGKETEKTTYSTDIATSTVLSDNGHIVVRSEHGGVTSMGAKFLSATGTDICADQNVLLYSVKGETVTIKESENLFGLNKHEHTEMHEFVTPTLIADNGSTHISSMNGSIYGKGFVAEGAGKMEVSAAGRVNFARDILNNTVIDQYRGVTVSVGCFNIYDPVHDNGKKYTPSSLLNCDGDVARAEALIHSKTDLERTVNAFNFGVGLYNTVNGVMANGIGGELLQQLGLGDAHGFDPTFHFSLENAEMRSDYETLGSGGIYRSSLLVNAKEINFDNAFQIDVKNDVALIADKVELQAAELHSSASSHMETLGVGVDMTGKIKEVDASVSVSSSDSTTYVNEEIKADHVSIESNETHLKGANIECNSFDIKTGELNIETLQNTSESNSESASISTSGSIGASFDHQESKMIGEASGIYGKESVNVSADKIDMVAGKITSDGDVNVQSQNISAESLHDYKYETGGGINTNLNNFSDTHQGTSSNTHGKISTVASVNVDYENYQATQKSTMHGGKVTDVNGHIQGDLNTANSDGSHVDQNTKAHINLNIPKINHDLSQADSGSVPNSTPEIPESNLPSQAAPSEEMLSDLDDVPNLEEASLFNEEYPEQSSVYGTLALDASYAAIPDPASLRYAVTGSDELCSLRDPGSQPDYCELKLHDSESFADDNDPTLTGTFAKSMQSAGAWLEEKVDQIDFGDHIAVKNGVDRLIGLDVGIATGLGSVMTGVVDLTTGTSNILADQAKISLFDDSAAQNRMYAREEAVVNFGLTAGMKQMYNDIVFGDPYTQGNAIGNAATVAGTLFFVPTIATKIGSALSEFGLFGGESALAKNFLELESGICYGDPRDIRLTQPTVGICFNDGTRVNDLVSQLRSGEVVPEDVPLIRVFPKDGELFSIDNRRLIAFSAAGIDEIPMKIVSADDPEIAAKLEYQFDPVNREGYYAVMVRRAERAEAMELLRAHNMIKGNYYGF